MSAVDRHLSPIETGRAQLPACSCSAPPLWPTRCSSSTWAVKVLSRKAEAGASWAEDLTACRVMPTLPRT